jgi:hypothetical protein
MDVNNDAFILNKRVALKSIASKLAPTGDRLVLWDDRGSPWYGAPPPEYVCNAQHV